MNNSKNLYIILALSIIFVPAAYLFIAAVFVVRIFSGKITFKFLKYNKLILFILIYILIGTFFSDYTLISSVYGLMMILCLFAYEFSYASMDYTHEGSIRKFLYIISLIAFMVGFYQYINPNIALVQKWVDLSAYKLNKRIYSTFFNPNIYGLYINIILITVCNRVSFRNGKLELIVYYFGILSLFLTFSRSAWISLIISLIISGMLFDKQYLKNAVIISVVLILLDVSLGIGRSNPIKALDDSSFLYRLEIWKACIRIVKDYLFTGIGFGTLFKYIASYSDIVKTNIEHAHNLYLQVLTETGIIGFFSLLSVAFIVLKKSIYKIKKLNKKPWIPTFTIITMVLIHGMFDSVVLTPQIMMVSSIYAGIMKKIN